MEEGAKTEEKPAILVSAFEDEDSFGGLLLTMRPMLEKYFSIVRASEVDVEPSLLANIHGVLVAPACNLPSSYYDRAPKLRVVSTYSVGLDHINLHKMRDRGVKVGYLPEEVTGASADFAMTLILAHARNIAQGLAVMKTGSFGQNLLSKEVHGATLGIVGMGRIGFQVARRAMGFDMTILYHNRHRRSVEDEEAVKATYFPHLHDMLPRCDFVLITCPLAPETSKLFGPPEFRVMKSDATVINTARGGIVDTEALVEALTSGQIGGAALDVTDPEPLPVNHALLSMQNVIVTPHWASATVATRNKMAKMAVANLKAVLIDNRNPLFEPPL